MMCYYLNVHFQGKRVKGSWFRNLRERYHLEVLGIDGSLKLNWIFKK